MPHLHGEIPTELKGPWETDHKRARPSPFYGTYHIPDGSQQYDSQFKVVIAHEIGHGVQDKGGGAMPQSNYTPAGILNVPAICDCGYVEFPEDRSHCLQSKENPTPAINEGFAHYFASLVWSGTNPTQCTYPYYKNFFTGTEVLHPPVLRSCTDAVRWHSNNCPNGQGSTHANEWDWMNFQRALAFGSPAIGLSDVLDLHRIACDGRCGTIVDFTNYGRLRDAAQTKYGLGSVAYNRFTAAAATYGVDH